MRWREGEDLKGPEGHVFHVVGIWIKLQGEVVGVGTITTLKKHNLDIWKGNL